MPLRALEEVDGSPPPTPAPSAAAVVVHPPALVVGGGKGGGGVPLEVFTPAKRDQLIADQLDAAAVGHESLPRRVRRAFRRARGHLMYEVMAMDETLHALDVAPSATLDDNVASKRLQ